MVDERRIGLEIKAILSGSKAVPLQGETTMRKGSWQSFAAAAVATILPAYPAMSQAAQTWVSGTGTNNGLCTRAQPCRTFAAAYAVTATGGQIQVLSGGDFGRFDIKKSITIKAEGALGSVLVTEFNGFTIDAPASARIVLDGLDFDGTPDGVVAILILGARDVVVRNTTIRNFSSAGIYVNNLEPGTINLTVDNTVIQNADHGIWVSANGGGLSRAYVWNSKIIGSDVVGILASSLNSRVEMSGNVINRTPKSLDVMNGAVIASYGDNVLSDGDAPTAIAKK